MIKSDTPPPALGEVFRRNFQRLIRLSLDGKNADQIVVLEKGEIVEIGTHQELTKKQGAYYQLVKNQLEL